MNFEGRVSIEVVRGCSGGAVTIAFTQPGRIDRVLRGKTSAQAMELVPTLFSLCAMAQTQAAQCAIDAASSEEAGSNADLACRQCLTEMETLRENALRVACDWPRFLGEAVDKRPLKPLMRLVPELNAALAGGAALRIDRAQAYEIIGAAEAILQDFIFAESHAVWDQRRSADAVKEWAGAARTPAARLLARTAQAGWEMAGLSPVIPLQPLATEDVCNWLNETGAGLDKLPAPQRSAIPETTLLARHVCDSRLANPGATMYPECGLWDRLVARLIELSALPGRMRDLIDDRAKPDAGRTVGAGIGMSEVLAARGKLSHVAKIEHGRIIDYRILPPTRWNFDANGIAARALHHVTNFHAEDAELLSELVVNAIDPCVGHTVRIN